MLERVGNSKDVVAGTMRVFDVAGIKVNVAGAGGHLHAFDAHVRTAGARSRGASLRARQ